MKKGKGGHSKNHGHSGGNNGGSPHNNHYFYRGGYRGGYSNGPMESNLDSMASGLVPPTFFAGIYTFSGNQASFMAQLDSLTLSIDPMTAAPLGLSIEKI